MRNTKTINSDPTPQCSPLLLASSASTTTIPATQATPLKTRTTTRTTHAILVTNPTNRAGRRGGEGGTGEQGESKQSSGGTKKGSRVYRRQPYPPHRPDEAGETLPARATTNLADNDVFMIICELHKMRRKVRERKEWLWQLLLQRSDVPATLSFLLLRHPSILQLVPPVPQGPSPGTTLLIKEWLLCTTKKKDTGRSSGRTIW